MYQEWNTKLLMYEISMSWTILVRIASNNFINWTSTTRIFSVNSPHWFNSPCQNGYAKKNKRRNALTHARVNFSRSEKTSLAHGGGVGWLTEKTPQLHILQNRLNKYSIIVCELYTIACKLMVSWNVEHEKKTFLNKYMSPLSKKTYIYTIKNSKKVWLI